MASCTRSLLLRSFVWTSLWLSLSRAESSSHEIDGVAIESLFADPEITENDSRPSICCSALSHLVPEKVLFKDAEAYTASNSQFYYGQSARMQPDCIAQPDTTKDVASIVQLLTHHAADGRAGCDFAIKSAGHGGPGFSNIDGGVLIDLSRLNSVSVSKDRKTVEVGAGATWGQIYSHLTPHNVTAVGGRVEDVAAGGFLTGSGISFYSMQYGFGSDRVSEFEVVLAGGEVVRANANDHAALYAALKGVQSAIGIVTAFTLETIPLGPVYGGGIAMPWTMDTKKGTVDALHEMAANYDSDASIATIFRFSVDTGYLIYNNLFYAKPDADAFKLYRDIEPNTHVMNTMRVTTHDDLVHESTLGTRGPSARRSLSTGTVTAEHGTINGMVDVYERFMAQHGGIAGMATALIFEPMPASMLAASADAGPSILGWQGEAKENLMCWAITWEWANESDDGKVEKWEDELYRLVDWVGSVRGLKRKFLYLNYANKKQDVFGSYGADGLEKLREVSEKYDAEGAFRRRRKGGFDAPAPKKKTTKHDEL